MPFFAKEIFSIFVTSLFFYFLFTFYSLFPHHPQCTLFLLAIYSDLSLFLCGPLMCFLIRVQENKSISQSFLMIKNNMQALLCIVVHIFAFLKGSLTYFPKFPCSYVRVKDVNTFNVIFLAVTGTTKQGCLIMVSLSKQQKFVHREHKI